MQLRWKEASKIFLADAYANVPKWRVDYVIILLALKK